MRARIFAIILLLCSVAHGQAAEVDPAPAAPPAEADRALERAKELFRRGVALFQAGDVERALEAFLRSRDTYPSAKNLTNAAICLDRLGRYDEALEMYEEVLVRHAAELEETDRAALTPAMASLRAKVGSIDATADVVGASILIDGKPRGNLPRSTPLRVLAGRRHVRVLKNGYRAYERSVEIKAGRTLRVDAHLVALTGTGLLRVEDTGQAGSEVFVDRVSVGTTPWEGSLAPGAHVIWTRRADLGTAPTAATVLAGQTTLVRLRSAPLGSTVRIVVAPSSARIRLGNVDLGAGGWEGRLPAGAYRVSISEEGYRSETRILQVARGELRPEHVRVTLVVDASHPRWPRSASGRIEIDAFAGYALGASLGAESEQRCADECSSELAHGPWLGARGGYRFPANFAIELALGYVFLEQKLSRRVTAGFPRDAPQHLATYDLQDEIELTGPFASAGLSHRFGARIGIVPRLHFGAVLFTSRDAVRGTGSAGGQTLPAYVDDAGQTVRSAAPFVKPEIQADASVGHFRFGVSLAAAIFFVDGPRSSHGSLRVPLDCNDPSQIGCAPATDVVAGERAYGPFVVLIPSLVAGVTLP